MESKEKSFGISYCSECVAASKKPLQASVFCKECAKEFCDECAIEWHKSKQEHRIEALVTKLARESLEQVQLCAEHNSEKKVAFCFSCDRAVCKYCAGKYHTDHNVRSGAAAEARIGNTELQRTRFQSLFTDFVSERIKTPIRNNFLKIAELLKAKENELIGLYTKRVNELARRNSLLACLMSEVDRSTVFRAQEDGFLLEEQIQTWRKELAAQNLLENLDEFLNKIEKEINKFHVGGEILELNVLKKDIETKLTLTPELRLCRKEGLMGWRSAVLIADEPMAPCSGIFSWETKILQPPVDSIGLGFICGVIKEYSHFDFVDQKPYESAWYLCADGSKGSFMHGEKSFLLKSRVPEKEFILGMRLDYRSREGVLTISIDGAELGVLHSGLRGRVHPFFAVSNASGQFEAFPFMNFRRIVL